MKIIGRIKYFFAQSISVVFNPHQKWESLKDEANAKGVFSHLILPWFLILAVAVFLGQLIFASVYGFVINDVIILTARKILLLFMVFLASTMILYEVSRKYNIPLEFDTSRRIIAYSMLPLLIVTTFAALFPFLRIVMLGGFYSLYLLYTAPTVIYKIKTERNVAFFLILISGTFFSYFIISILLHKLAALIIF